MLFDAHSHLDKYTDEFDGVLGTIERQEILTVSVSVDPESFIRTREIAALSDLVIPALWLLDCYAPGAEQRQFTW